MPSQCYPCHFRPFIENVDDRLPDLFQERVHVRSNLQIKRLFSDTALLSASVYHAEWFFRAASAPRRHQIAGCYEAASDARPRASVARTDLYFGLGYRPVGAKVQIHRMTMPPTPRSHHSHADSSTISE